MCIISLNSYKTLGGKRNYAQFKEAVTEAQNC